MSTHAPTPPDTSARGTRRDRGLPTTPRPSVAARRFFPTVAILGKIKAPSGYAFNRRGDLINLRREAMRRERSHA